LHSRGRRVIAMNIKCFLTLGIFLSAIVSADRVYVSNQTSGNIEFFDTPITAGLTGTIVGVTSSPRGICVSPDNRKVYVVSQGFGSLVVIDAVTQQIERTVAIPGATALLEIAITPDGSKVYITDNVQSATTSPVGGVFVVNTTTFAVSSVTNSLTPGFRSPFGIVVSPDGTRAYVTNQNPTAPRPQHVSVIDTSTDAVIQNFASVGRSSRGIAVSPDGAFLYVANSDEGGGAAPNGDSFSFVNTATGLCSTVVLPSAASNNYNPFSIAVSPDNQRVYLTSSLGTTAPTGQLYIYPTVAAGLTTASTPISTTSNLNRPRGVVVASDSSEAYFGIFGSSGGDGTTVRGISPTGTLNPLVVSMGNDAQGPGYLAIGQPPEISLIVNGQARRNQFLGQTELYNVVTWSAPSGVTPTEYRVFRDSAYQNLVTTVPAGGCLCYQDHNLCPSTAYTYYVVAYVGDLIVAESSVSVHSLCCP
jgi:YVTN family beta-propeller protein